MTTAIQTLLTISSNEGIANALTNLLDASLHLFMRVRRAVCRSVMMTLAILLAENVAKSKISVKALFF